MQIKLTKRAPQVAGFYLVKFDECSGLHLVEVKITGDKREIFADNCFNAKPLFFHEFPEAWWSEEPVDVII